ncbi:MAG: glutamine-hydrolyzing GMP synthase [Clostridiales bacterium]|jgi:GMP synthase (glutamine-hydrolysing)|nr:glutamine-hydrolyzing GMP synthase [Clostridiales bacterium]
MEHETIIVLDFGGLYEQLIARQVRANNIYCEVLPFDTPINTLMAKQPKGFIFTEKPIAATDGVDSLAGEKINQGLLELGIPVLGISAKSLSQFNINEALEPIGQPGGLISAVKQKNIYLADINPEDIAAFHGNELLEHFLYNICGLNGDWLMSDFAEGMVESLKQKVGSKKAICALSGGVDSTVAAVMVHKAIGNNLTCIFVDHGLMRLNEGDEVMGIFDKFGLNTVRVNAQDRFLNKLKGVSNPEEKRKIIGEEFIRVFEEEAKKIGGVDYLVQGTIYPDIIESGTKNSGLVKSHHNVGGLPDVIDFKEIIEPLRDLFKDEVRKVGLTLGIDEDLVYRQPFPGPGLAVRSLGELTKEKLDILRQADFIYRDEIKKAKLDRVIWQYFAVLTGLKSVGVKSGERTYSYTIALRAVTSVDAMTATWYPIPFETLDSISKRIVNECPQVNRVVYDITSKPPATIEWE